MYNYTRYCTIILGVSVKGKSEHWNKLTRDGWDVSLPRDTQNPLGHFPVRPTAGNLL